MPSYVAFTDQGRLIGEPAKEQISENAENTIYDSKRLIGRRFEDEVVQNDIKLWPFKVVNDNGKPKIRIGNENSNKLLLPEEISAMLLSKMKQIAENYLGFSVEEAVITVPAYFNDAQRSATMAAGTVAGLKVVRMINEPTAAGMAYGLDIGSDAVRTILVYDFGGGTLDVSILRIDEGVFEVLATDGDTHLGGQDIDANMGNYFLYEFKDKYNKTIPQNNPAFAKLFLACEKSKRVLSSQSEAEIIVPALYESHDFKSKMSRAFFEHLNRDVFKSTFKCVEQCLKAANRTPKQITEVVMVGGCSRIPKLRLMMKEMFPNTKINTSINPDEAIAYGAAIQAAVIGGVKASPSMDILLFEVAALSLGVEVEGGLMSTVIQRNSSIPIKASANYTTVQDNQTVVTFKVYEGERGITKGNMLLGQFKLENIPKAPREIPILQVTFEIDHNGILVVSAVDTKTKNSNRLVIQNHRGRLSAEEVAIMIENAEAYYLEDESRKRNVTASQRLKNFASDTKTEFENKSWLLTNKIRRNAVIEKSTAVLKWVSENENADKEAYDQRYEDLRSYVANMKV